MKPEKLAVRVAHLNMASIHTSYVIYQSHSSHYTDKFICRAIFVTHALFELALLTPEQMEEVRAEVTAAIEAEGGVVNKAAVGKFHKLDSLLKEIGRWHPLFASTHLSLFLSFASFSHESYLSWDVESDSQRCSDQ